MRARDVGLDQSGDDIHRRPLRGEHQVNSRRPRLLRDPGDELIDLLPDDHHQVRELVDDDDHHGFFRQRGRLVVRVLRPQRVRDWPAGLLRPHSIRRL